MLNLKIDPTPIATAIPFSYSVEIEVMGGDGESFETFIIDGFTDSKTDLSLLENLLELLKRCAEQYPNGRRGDDLYLDSVCGFEAWFSDTNLDYAEEDWHYPYKPQELEENLALAKLVEEFFNRTLESWKKLNVKKSFHDYSWPNDPTSLGEWRECSYRSHEIFYFGPDAEKHKVSVIN